MKFNVKAHHVEITEALKEYAQKKMDKLERFFENIQEIVLDLNISDNSDENQRQIASATIFASGTIIRAKEASIDMYASIDLIFDKLEVQLKKYKERLKDRKQGSRKREFIRTSTPSDNRNYQEDIQNRFIPKPMDVEDAALLLEERKTSFLVFRNFKEEVNVIYEIEDNNGSTTYGLIETS